MKAVLISIRPEWCEKILNGIKTIEVRKTRPKLKPPFKCYIYQTRKPVQVSFSGTGRHISEYDKTCWYTERSGKVIGEFVCDGIYAVLRHPEIFAGYPLFFKQAMEDACMTESDIEAYSGGKDLYGWHITEPKIYDKPLPVSAFFNECIKQDCENCGQLQYDAPRNAWWCDDKKRLTRPPQSWCYVEELHE